jgi:hypothetical protein
MVAKKKWRIKEIQAGRTQPENLIPKSENALQCIVALVILSD